MECDWANSDLHNRARVGWANLVAMFSFIQTSHALKSAIMKANNSKHHLSTILQMVYTEWTTMSQSKIKRVKLLEDNNTTRRIYKWVCLDNSQNSEITVYEVRILVCSSC